MDEAAELIVENVAVEHVESGAPYEAIEDLVQSMDCVPDPAEGNEERCEEGSCEG